MDFLIALSGTFFGALFAFCFSKMQEDHDQKSKEICLLQEILTILGYQKNYFEDILKKFNENHNKDFVPLFQTKDKIYIKTLVIEEDIEWLKYGRVFDFVSTPEIQFEKIVFLINRRKNDGHIMLENLRKSIVGFQSIKRLMQKRDETFQDLDSLCPNHNAEDLKIKREFNDLIVFGKSITKKILRELTEYQSEFKIWSDNLKEYIKREYEENDY